MAQGEVMSKDKALEAWNRTIDEEQSETFRAARAGLVVGLVELLDWNAVDRARHCVDREELRAFLEGMTPLDSPSDPRWDLYLAARRRLDP
jgi:hypothetical protein